MTIIGHAQVSTTDPARHLDTPSCRANTPGPGISALSAAIKEKIDQKGYGFIQRDDGGSHVFVHISAVERAGLHRLDEWQKLVFELVPNRKTGKSSAAKLRAL
jgi:CspA family cold shock protein